MRKSFLVFVGFVWVCILGCGIAGAQVASDVMALVFDTEIYPSYDSGAPFVPVSGQLVLLNPGDSELHGFEVAIRSTDGQVFVIQSSVVEGAVNTLGSGEFSVSFETPLPAAPVTILATFQILPVHDDECIILTGVSSPSFDSEFPLIWSASGSPRPIDTYDMFENGVDAVVAGWVNPVTYGHYPPPCSSVVSVLGTSWGSLKARFR